VALLSTFLEKLPSVKTIQLRRVQPGRGVLLHTDNGNSTGSLGRCCFFDIRI